MMYCEHGRMEPQDCSICQQLSLVVTADQLLAGPDIDVLAEAENLSLPGGAPD